MADPTPVPPALAWPRAARQPAPLRSARSILLTILSVEVAILVVTGIALFFVYVPTEKQAWSGVFTSGDDWSLATGVRLVHQFVSALAFLTAIATGVVIALRGGATARRWPGVLLGAGLPVVTVLAAITGFLLPWDQLGISAVTVGSNLRGYTVLFDSNVRFVLSGGAEVTPGTVVGWLAVHALVLGLGVVTLLVLGWRRHARTSKTANETTVTPVSSDTR